MKRLILSVAVVAVIRLASGSASTAAIVNATGDIMLLNSAPASVQVHALESDSFAWGFPELSGAVLQYDVDVNIIESGFYKGESLANVYTLAAGTAIDSYFVNLDPIGAPGRSDPYVLVEGTLTFTEQIVGIIVHQRQLWDSETSGVHAPGTLYPPIYENPGRGVDVVDLDYLEISSDRRTVSFLLAARTPGDQFRVLIDSPISEPSSLLVWSLIGLSLIGAGWWRRGRTTRRTFGEFGIGIPGTDSGRIPGTVY